MPDAILISALTGDGLDSLLTQVERVLSEKTQSFRMFVPFTSYQLLSQIRKNAVIHGETYQDDGVVLLVEADQALMKSMCKEGIRILDDEIE